MPTILKIGYQSYLVKNDGAALKALQALCGAVKVESRHIHQGKNYREVFWPDARNVDSEISIRTVSTEQLIRSDPGDVVEFDEPKQLPFRTK